MGLSRICGETQTVHAITITPEMKASVQAGQYLFHYDPGFWPKRLIYGTPIGRGIWEQYVAEAKDYESAEAFEKAMMEQYGRLEEGDIAGQEKTDFFRQVWEEAHEKKREEEKPPEIPTPELPEEPEYDYADKAKAAQDVTDTEKAGKMARGEITDEEVEELSAKNEAETSELEVKSEAAEGETTVEREKLSEAERLIISLGDKLEAAIEETETTPSEGRRKTLEAQMRTLHEQFRTALLENLDAAEDLLGEMIWKRAIIFGEQIGGEEAVQQVGESYEKAVALGRELQAAIDERKLKGEREKAKKRHAESRAKIYAKKREQMKAFKAVLQDREKERRAIKKYKEAKKKLIADIMKPPGKSISYRGYAEVIAEMQAAMDPINRIKRTRWRRERAREFFANNPDAAALVSKEELDMIFSVILPDLPLSQLEQIDEIINRLRKLGRMKRSLQLEQRRRKREENKAQMITTVLRGQPPRKPVGRPKPS